MYSSVNINEGGKT